MAFGLAFTYLMSYGGAVVALANPFVGLLIYVCFSILCPGPTGMWYWAVPEGNYSKVLAIGLLVGWVGRGFGDWEFGRARVPILALLGYFGWNVVSAGQALIPTVAWGWVEAQAKVILPVLVGLTLIDSVEKLKQLGWVILLSHGAVAYELNVAYFNGFNRLHETGFGYMDNNCVAISLVSCTGLGLFLGLDAPRLWQKGIATACVVCMVHAVLLSMSRGGMLGLILVASVAFLVMPRRPIHYAGLLVAVLGTLAVTGPTVTDRFMSAFAGEKDRDNSAESRTKMWGICIEVVNRWPILGLGPHHFPVHATEFGLPPNKEAHTTWLQLAAELGYPGVLLLLAYFVLPVAWLLPMVRESHPVPDPWVRTIARMVVASTAGFVFTAQFVTLPGLETPYYITLIGLGALKLASAESADVPADDSARELKLP